MTFDNTNTGVLFGNLESNEPKEDHKPNFTGSINVEGREYELSAWVKLGKPGGKMAGRKFLSINVKAKQPKPSAPIDRGSYDWKTAESREKAPEQKQVTTDEFNDDIPF